MQVTAAVERLRREIAESAPLMGPPVDRWLDRLAGTETVARYFLHPRAFPVFALPGWMAESAHRRVPAALARDMAYSTLSGSCWIRLLDDVVDRHARAAPELLPAAAIFQGEFERAYRPHFPADHRFWEILRRRWYQSAAATIHEAAEGPRNAAAFDRLCAAKFAAAVVPLAAAAAALGCTRQLPSWVAFAGRMAAAVQFTDDLFDWHDDLARGQPVTWLVAEARRRGRGQAMRWLLNDGWRWGGIGALAPLRSPRSRCGAARQRRIAPPPGAPTSRRNAGAAPVGTRNGGPGRGGRPDRRRGVQLGLTAHRAPVYWPGPPQTLLVPNRVERQRGRPAMKFEELVDKVMHDDGFRDQLKANPHQALHQVGVKATPEMVNAFKAMDWSSIHHVADTMKANAGISC